MASSETPYILKASKLEGLVPVKPFPREIENTSAFTPARRRKKLEEAVLPSHLSAKEVRTFRSEILFPELVRVLIPGREPCQGIPAFTGDVPEGDATPYACPGSKHKKEGKKAPRAPWSRDEKAAAVGSIPEFTRQMDVLFHGHSANCRDLRQWYRKWWRGDIKPGDWRLLRYCHYVELRDPFKEYAGPRVPSDFTQFVDDYPQIISECKRAVCQHWCSTAGPSGTALRAVLRVATELGNKLFNGDMTKLNGFSVPETIAALVFLDRADPRYSTWILKCYGSRISNFASRCPKILETASLLLGGGFEGRSLYEIIGMDSHEARPEDEQAQLHDCFFPDDTCLVHFYDDMTPYGQERGL